MMGKVRGLQNGVTVRTAPAEDGRVSARITADFEDVSPTPEEIRAMRVTVAMVVPRLSPEDTTVVNSRGEALDVKRAAPSK